MPADRTGHADQERVESRSAFLVAPPIVVTTGATILAFIIGSAII